MKKDLKNKYRTYSELRRLARERIKRVPSDTQDLSDLSAEERVRLIQELRIHQIELEMQNEELLRAQHDAETYWDKFSDYFDFSPLGYIVIDREGLILEGNLTCADMLGVERGTLTGKPFTRFVTRDTQDIFYLHRNELFNSGDRQISELKLTREDGSEFHARLNSIAFRDTEGAIDQARMAVIDIDIHKIAEEKLIESEARYRFLFDNMLDGFAYCRMIYDERNQPIDFVFMEVNESYESLTGSKREDVIGKRVTEVIPEIREAHPEVFEIYGKVAKTGNGEIFDLYFEPFDRWYSISVYSPRKGYFVAVFDDITEARLAGEVLKKSEERYRAVVEDLPAMVCRFLPDGRLTFVNRAYCEYFQKSPEELIDHNFFQFIPEDQREGVKNIYMSLTSEKPTITYDHQAFSPDGNIRWQQWTDRVLFNERGEVLEFQSIGRDITDRKMAENKLRESEKRFRDLVESSPIGIFIIQGGQVVYKNPALDKIFGGMSPLKSSKDYEEIFMSDGERFEQICEGIRAGEQKNLEGEFRIYPFSDADDIQETRWVYCRVSSIVYQGETAILVNMMDITRMKELELREKDKLVSLGRVAAGVAHEIRNPLSGINIYLNTMKNILNSGENFEKLDDIVLQLKSASSKIESVIRRSLDFTRPGEFSFVPIEINKPIEKAIDFSMVNLRKSGIEITKDLAENLPSCLADSRLIQQVILNLISNAADAMRGVDGVKKIAVASSEKDNRIYLKVSDSGPGVPKELRERIFEPFFTTKNENTGLGLSISNRIITDHGGRLDVTESKLGGAEFIMEFPVNTGSQSEK